ncbi:OmpA family protein [Reichenbachiella agarivorans]|uniref:OmpA family protein n=1 Tax=Reichenbachiella agarivorans TaxID=2979464 RepID=A0ABY6CQX7_9BACT|nr:OmpA family protein [Reichenbachiella agarivorans]UXP31768.1 OmpA family protein [Reichenbachiella agarivorans]
MTQSILKYTLLLSLTIVLVLPIQAQYANLKYVGSSSEKKGDIEMANESYMAAIKYYKYALQEDSTNTSATLKLARCYRRVNDNLKAEPLLREFIGQLYQSKGAQVSADSGLYVSDSTKAFLYYEFIEALASNKKYDEASYWYERYKELNHANPEQFARLEAYAQYTDFYKDQKYYSVSHLSNAPDRSDFGPAYYKDGFLFVSDRHEKVIVRSKAKENRMDYFDIYYTSKRPDGGFVTPKLVSKKANSMYHEGPLCAYLNGSKVALTRNSLNEKKKVLRRESDQVNTLSIYFAELEDNVIQNVTSFPYNSSEYNNAYPAVAEDGSFMIYSSDQPGGYGLSDLYITYWKNDGWTEPKNLGPEINTSERDVFPSLNGNILYFASNGHPGLGGLDVYKTVLNGDKVGTIKNVGAPVNSNKDDFGLITKTGKQGYFVSNRRNELNDVIYSYEYTKKNDDKLIAFVYAVDSSYQQTDSVTNEELPYKVLSNASINVVDTRLNSFLAPIEVRNDTFIYVLDTGVEYSVIAAKQQYFTRKMTYLSGSELNGELDWPIPLDSMEVGKTMVLHDILYDFDKATLRDSSKFQLNYLIVMLQDNPTMKAELHSHTDSRGSESYNQRLSQRRAQSVVDYMVNAGINEDRLVPVGFGESKPIIDCSDGDCTEANHQLNRRTELLVTDL